MEPKKIAKLIDESPDRSHLWQRCTCGNPFASIGDEGDISCLNPQCPNYDPEYKKALDALIELDPKSWMTNGVLTTKRGNEIEFVGIIDKGHYYVVFIPKKWEKVTRHNPRSRPSLGGPKYKQFISSIKVLWPYSRARYDPERYQQLLALNAPAVILANERGKKAGEKGAFGAYLVKYDAKTITVRKDNVADIDIF